MHSFLTISINSLTRFIVLYTAFDLREVRNKSRLFLFSLHVDLCIFKISALRFTAALSAPGPAPAGLPGS
jgi:hypothetical protein